jgi:hypothetical protein
MTQHPVLLRLSSLACAVALASGAIVHNAHADGVLETVTAFGIDLVPTVTYEASSLTLEGPNGYRAHLEGFGIDPQGLTDGIYIYELRLNQGRGEDGGTEVLHTGTFEVQDGAIVVPEEPQEPTADEQSSLDWIKGAAATIARAGLDFLVPPAHAQDLTASSIVPTVNYVDTNGQNGVPNVNVIDTLGAVASIPPCSDGSTDVVYRVRDARTNTSVVGICSRSSNAQNTIVVDGLGDMSLANSALDIDRSSQNVAIGGDVRIGSDIILDTGVSEIGIGTQTPAAELHIADGVPEIILEDTDTGGATFTLRSVQGPEFSILDQSTNRGVFAIEEGAESQAICIDGRGSGGGAGFGGVGFGTCSPGGDFQVTDLDGTGTTGFQLALGTTGRTWTFAQGSGGNITVNLLGSGGEEAAIYRRFDGDGPSTLTVQGSVRATAFNTSSSRETKHEFAALDTREILEKLDTLPVLSWRYKHDANQRLHYGVVAEDFQQAFGLGDGATIATVDADGVAIAAIQGLHDLVKERDAEIDELRGELAELKKLVRSFTSVSLAD